MSYIGSSKIAEMYVGSTKIAQAYVGSTLVFQLASPPSIDSVTIGSQTWMSKNLAIDDGQGGIYTQTVNYGQGDVVEYYYTWEAALRVANSVDGWHLPTSSETNTLSSTVGTTPGTKLKSTYGWSSGNGTDIYGFGAFPAGYYNSGSFYSFKQLSLFWTADEGSAANAYQYGFRTNSSMSKFNVAKTQGVTLRLIKDS